MLNLKSQVQRNQEAERHDESTRFSKSLMELKDLSSQLHNAADYCEKSFFNADYLQKKMVVENTKEYICGAIITVVDHLGSISSNLELQLSENNTIPETEFRINALNQGLVACQQFNHTLGLINLRWHVNFPRYSSRYIFPPSRDVEKSLENSRKCESLIAAKSPSKREFVAEEDVPLFLYTSNDRVHRTKNSGTCEFRSASVLPVRNDLSVLPKNRSSFQFESTPRLKRNMLNWRLRNNNNDIFSIIRKAKRTT